MKRTASAIRRKLLAGLSPIRLSWRFLVAPKKPRIIWALTPPATLRNLGDHAQVLAVRSWLTEHFPDHHVIEVNKDDAIYGQRALKRNATTRDLIFLHSGGNLGDRGMWSERGRRKVIENFQENRIVQLPQTVSFSDSVAGKNELLASQRIYNEHPSLTLMSRDRESLALATRYFPKANHLQVPDFVTSLSLSFFGLKEVAPTPGSTLAILRRDSESAMKGSRRVVLDKLPSDKTSVTDTSTCPPIPPWARRILVAGFIHRIQGFEVVVTDRLHGLIFAMLANRPTVVLGTIDHKLTASFEWFSGLGFAIYCPNLDELDQCLVECRRLGRPKVDTFKRYHFDSLPEKLNLEDGIAVPTKRYPR